MQQLECGAGETPGTCTFLCLQDLDDLCVVLISNLPEKGCSAEEVSNLAKPFGGLRDVLIVSSHQKVFHGGFTGVSASRSSECVFNKTQMW